MALPIKETPTLTGKEAENFLKLMEKNKNKIAPKKDVKRALDMMLAMVKKSKNKSLL